MSQDITPDPEYQQVVDHFEAGRYREMTDLAARLVRQRPDHARCWHMYGLGALICGDVANALAALRRASQLQPDNPEVWDHLGAACNGAGLFDEALRASARGLEIDAERAESWINHGKNLKDLGRDAEAIEAYRRAIALKPGLVEAHNNLGVALLDARDFEAAAAAFRAAVAVAPGYFWAHDNLGIALMELGRLDEAREACRQALTLEAAFSRAWNNLGNIEHRRGNEEAAVEAYRRALELAPGDPEVNNNLGSSLAVLGRGVEARQAFEAALAAQPDNATTWNNLANALPELGDKLAAIRRALALDANFAQARSNLLFHLHYLPGLGDEALLAEARAYGAALQASVRPFAEWPNTRKIDRPIRVGLVSADFCEHPVAYFLDSLMAELAAPDLQLVAYYNERREDDYTRRFRARVAHWRPIFGLPDAAVAEMIRADAVDILVDLSGHTAGNRLPLFALRPAPIQASWLGYFGTTGVPGIDYLLVDHTGAPPGDEGKFTETLWRLPETRLCFSAPPEIAIAPPPSSLGPGLVFGCFNNQMKLNAEVIATWARILREVGDARLYLKNARLSDSGVRERMLAAFAEYGIDTARLRLEGPSGRELYLNAYNEVDITLDPFPYTGGTTTAESLWMGVPVLTLAGSSLISRQGASLLKAAGLPKWIAATPDEYVAKAVEHAAARARLAPLRAGLRAQLASSALMDAPRFALQLRNAFKGMWIRHCARG